jgi:hypothetical protein
MRNFGVTTAVFDRAFGTFDPTTTVTLPRRIAPVWMLDADDEVRPELRAEYVVRGTRRMDPAQAERDRAAASTRPLSSDAAERSGSTACVTPSTPAAACGVAATVLRSPTRSAGGDPRSVADPAHPARRRPPDPDGDPR